jgi:hypothetical protein
MEFDSTGPSRSPETTYNIGRSLTTTIALDAYFRQVKDQSSLVASKSLGPGLDATLTGSSVGRHDYVHGLPGEKLILAGLSWNY